MSKEIPETTDRDTKCSNGEGDPEEKSEFAKVIEGHDGDATSKDSQEKIEQLWLDNESAIKTILTLVFGAGGLVFALACFQILLPEC